MQGRTDPASLVTVHQQALANRVRDTLTHTSVVFTEQLTGTADEAFVTFTLVGSRIEEALEVRVSVLGDQLNISANGAEFFSPLGAFLNEADAVARWSDHCVDILDRLLNNDLRISSRRTVLGGLVGAIWIPGPDGGWSGDVRSFGRKGQEQIFLHPWAKVTR